MNAFRLSNQNDENSALAQIGRWEVENYAKKPNNSFDFSRDWIGEKRNYKFNYQVFSNQYTETDVSLVTSVPDVVPSAAPAVVTGTGNLVFRRYDATVTSPAGTVLSGTGIVLSNTTGTGASGITLRSAHGVEITTGTGLTAVQRISTQSGAATWNGGFVLGDSVDPVTFVSQDAKMSVGGALLSAMNIEKIVKV